MAQTEIKACLTFDVDLVEYANGWQTVNEFDVAVPRLVEVLGRNPDVRTTWFVRLDEQIQATHGSADHFFQKYGSTLDALRAGGHEVAWHPHCYRRSDGRWGQNVDEASVAGELERCAAAARAHGVGSVRMGWGFHTNRTMRLLSDLGFAVDSSAIPRPRYSWEETEKDWETTPPEPYFPSEADYRVPGRPALPILEVPMSVTEVRAPYDGGEVLRYLNLAYHPPLLREPLRRWLSQRPHLVTITHPYELVGRGQPHGLLAFDLRAFELNLEAVRELAEEQGRGLSFLTVSEFAATNGGTSHA